MPPASSAILVLNGGSSSVKFAVFLIAEPPRRLWSGGVERIGLPGASLRVRGESPAQTFAQPVAAPDHAAAIELLLHWLKEHVQDIPWVAVGHRVVHGGPKYHEPELITAELVAELRRLRSFDPEHLPAEIRLIEALQLRRPELPQVACFDTSFHHAMPRVAQLLPIPRRYEGQGLRRYGFHGLSYEFLLAELARVAGADAADGRVLLAHLGSGASIAAVQAGEPMDTSMGFSPASGLVMGTRSGDLDPGLFSFFAEAGAMTPSQVQKMVNHESGLLGISETSSDMRDLLAREADDPRAAEGVELFCYQARKWIGAFAAVLGGLDTVVFSAGIGENCPAVRARICRGLAFLGVEIDEARNAAQSAVISTEASAVTVRVIRTDEEIVIAQAVARLLEFNTAQSSA